MAVPCNKSTINIREVITNTPPLAYNAERSDAGTSSDVIIVGSSVVGVPHDDNVDISVWRS